MKSNMFTKKYEITKTLTFRLIPNRDTIGYLESEKEMDTLRSINYPIVKNLIDDAYRRCIRNSYKNVNIDFMPLYKIIKEMNNENKEKVEKECEKYRKALAKILTSKEEYKSLNQSNFLKTLLESEHLSQSEKDIVATFHNFTTYFISFYKNRENIFTTKDISASLYNRMINENFFTFAINIDTIEDIEKKAPQIIEKVETNLKEGGFIDQNENLKDLFKPNAYNNYLIQEGIDLYNIFLGGFVKGDVKYTGLNEEINLHNQTHKERSDKLKKLIRLKKQILASEGKKVIETIENDQYLYETIKKTIEDNNETDVLNKVENLINNINSYEKSKIYISTKGLAKLSFKLFGDYGKVINIIKDEMLDEIAQSKKSKKVSKTEKAKIYKLLGISDEYGVFKPQNLSLGFVEDYIEEFIEEYDTTLTYEYIEMIEEDVKIAKEKLAHLTDIIYLLDEKTIKDEKNIQLFKEYCDVIQSLLYDYKLLSSKKEVDIDTNFYYDYYEMLDMFNINIKSLNLVRNYVTKENHSKEKMKLNFNTPSLAKGWSKSKEEQNKSIILRRGKNYYLGIMKSPKKVNINEIEKGEENYEKMDYFLFPEPFRMIPKCMFPNAVRDHFDNGATEDYVLDTQSFAKEFVVTKELYDLYNKDVEGVKKFKKEYAKITEDYKGQKEALTFAIKEAKKFLKSYKSTLEFDYSNLKKAEEYNDISEFYNDVAKSSYKVEFNEVDKKKVDELVKEGEIYLFRIYNKDFAKRANGRKNLYTIYLETLFREENLKNPTMRLSGNAEIFFRERSIENPVIHEIGDRIVNKTYIEDGILKAIPDENIIEINEALKCGKENELKPKSKEYLEKATIKTVDKTLIKDRRYTKDQYQLSFPIKMNTKEECYSLNQDIAKEIAENDGVNIIGIDRGEKNLIYVSVIDEESNIIEQKSLNVINGFDYQDKLDKVEKRRDEARKSWKTIGNIKNLKEGYISQAVYEVISLIKKHKAIVVMENLNVGFKRGRMKVEKEVYQKFENMLANKLSFLVYKDAEENEVGSAYNAYQLAKPISEVGNQVRSNGIIFYVPAGYTSQIDPVTGFANIFKLNKKPNLNELAQFIEKFENISFDKGLNMFKFSFDYKDFAVTQTMPRTKWEVFTNEYRIVKVKNNIGKWESEKVFLTEEMIKVFNKEGVEYEDVDDLKDVIIENKELLREVYRIFRYAISLRNSNEEEDSIISPIQYEEGKFFNSNKDYDKIYPIDADANGAFNIARKGLLAVNNMLDDYHFEGNIDDVKINTAISNQEWFEYVQK